jgi:hypothetical protein
MAIWDGMFFWRVLGCFKNAFGMAPLTYGLLVNGCGRVVPICWFQGSKKCWFWGSEHYHPGPFKNPSQNMPSKPFGKYPLNTLLKNADFEVPNITILDPSKTLHKICPQNPSGNTLEIPFKKIAVWTHERVGESSSLAVDKIWYEASFRSWIQLLVSNF